MHRIWRPSSAWRAVLYWPALGDQPTAVVNLNIFNELGEIGREVRQQLRPNAQFGRNRGFHFACIFVDFGSCYWLAGMIELDGFVGFKKILDVAFSNGPQLLLDPLALLSDQIFRLAA